MTRGYFAVVVMIVAAICVVSLAPHRATLISRPDAAALERLNTFCDTVRDAFEADARALAGSDDEARIAAADRFFGPVALHDEVDLLLCTATPPHIERIWCWVANDWPCLAKQARFAAASISPGSMSTDMALHRLNDHCDGVRYGAKSAAQHYERHEPDPWGAQIEHYSTNAEIALCSPWPSDVERIVPCREHADYDCLANIAREVEASVYVPDDPER